MWKTKKVYKESFLIVFVLHFKKNCRPLKVKLWNKSWICDNPTKTTKTKPLSCVPQNFFRKIFENFFLFSNGLNLCVLLYKVKIYFPHKIFIIQVQKNHESCESPKIIPTANVFRYFLFLPRKVNAFLEPRIVYTAYNQKEDWNSSFVWNVFCL